MRRKTKTQQSVTGRLVGVGGKLMTTPPAVAMGMRRADRRQQQRHCVQEIPQPALFLSY